MKIVYLDQNIWIELAKVINGKVKDADLNKVLNLIRAKIRSKEIVLPLSETHYIETTGNSNANSRRRLGEVMWKVSEGHTLASRHMVMRNDIELALRRFFTTVEPRPFQLLGKGLEFAFDYEYTYRIPVIQRKLIPHKRMRKLEAKGQDIMERTALTGAGPGGVCFDPPQTTFFSERFKKHLETLPDRVAGLSAEERENYLHLIALEDIEQPLMEVLNFHGLSYADDLLALEVEHFRDFVDSIPGRRIEIHLHRQVLKNPNLKHKLSDLEDWDGLGLACAHCDFVVCEKHFASMISRDGFQPNAQVLSSLKKLPEVL